ncbi:MAG: hypothetical protein CMH54_06485 [Myxococcales bacterium]|nr:hypothetical protein [Myxococcales bacterium]
MIHSTRRFACFLVCLLACLFATSWSTPVHGQEEEAEQELRLETPPKLKTKVEAELPADTKFPADEVSVILTIEVNEEGAVTNVAVVEGPGEPFQAAALAAVKQYVFEPGRLNTGDAVPVTIKYRLRFTRPPLPPARLRGILLERGTRKPLADLPVVVRSGPDDRVSTVTDAKGRFEVEIKAGALKVISIPPDHQRLDVEVKMWPGEEVEEIYYLLRRPRANVTVVQGVRIRREVTKRVIPKDVVVQMAGTAGDTIRAVENMPGVSRRPFGGGGQLILRGANPGDSKVLLEGMEIPLIYHFGGLRSSFNSAFLDALEFVPGNFSAEYGRAVGGIVDVKVRDPADDMFRGEVDLNIYDAGFVAEGPVDSKWSMGGAFHRSYIDTLLPAFLPEDLPLTFDTLPRYYDYQFTAVRKGKNKERFRTLFYGSMDKLVLLFPQAVGDSAIKGELSTRTMFHYLQFDYRKKYWDRLEHNTRFRMGMTDIDFRFGVQFFFNLNIKSLALRDTISYRVHPKLLIRSGLDVQNLYVNISLQAPYRPTEGEDRVPIGIQEVNSTLETLNYLNFGSYLELVYTPIEALELLPSLRLDYYQAIDRWTVDPRIVSRWTATPGTVLKGGFGYYQQQPQYDQTDPTLGNPNLLATRSLQSTLGLEQEIAPGITLDLAGFHKTIDRGVVRNANFGSQTDLVPYVNDGTGRIYGAEVLLKAAIGERFYGWLAYTYQRSFRTDHPGEDERRFDFDQPHILTMLGTYALGRGWQFSLRFRYYSGNPYTPIVGHILDANTGDYVPIFGENNAGRLGAFHQLDARIDKTWTFATWKLNLYLDVQNVFMHGNPEAIDYNYDYTQTTYTTGIPILPILGLKGSW